MSQYNFELEAEYYPQTPPELDGLLIFNIVSTKSLYEALPTANGRHSEWLNASMKQLKKLNTYLKEKNLPPIDTRNRKEKGTFIISAECALGLLYVGQNYSQHIAAFLHLRKVSKKELPHIKHIDGFLNTHRSRNELKFAQKLFKKVEENELDVTIDSQVMIGKYRVDFLITLDYLSSKELSRNRFVLEYDEEYHQTPSQKAVDSKRDKDILENHDLRVLRISSELEDAWLSYFDEGEKFFDINAAELRLISEAIFTGSNTFTSSCINKLIGVYWYSAYWGKRTKNLLAFFAKLLDRHQIPYTRTKIKSGTVRSIRIGKGAKQIIQKKYYSLYDISLFD